MVIVTYAEFCRVAWLMPMDFEDYNWPKALKEASFNLVHVSHLCGSVADWQKMYKQILR